MRTPAFVCAALAVALASTIEAAEPLPDTVTSVRVTDAALADGSQHRLAAFSAMQSAQARDFDGARTRLAPVLAWCHEQARTPGRRAVFVADEDQLTQLRKEVGNDPPLYWVDLACASALQTQAFIAVEERRTADAIAALEALVHLAPYWPEAQIELGYTLGHSGKLDEGMAAYRRAEQLARTHPASAASLGAALRGIGWTQVEMGDLEAARATYEQSLVAEPGNATALGELDYIRQQKDARKP